VRLDALLLQDCLGGDAIVVALACLSPGAPAVSAATMRLLGEARRHDVSR
jgi:hypothetical protein